MLISNLTGQWIYLNQGYSLSPDNLTEIAGNIYSGNEVLKNQLDHLFSEGKISLMGEDVPEDLITTLENENNELDFSLVYNPLAYAALSVEDNFDGLKSGKLDLGAENESRSYLSSYAEHEDDSRLYISKSSNETGSLVDLKIDGQNVLKLGATGALAFYDGEGVTQQVLNPDTATVEDVVNFLIDLGLVRGE